MTHTPPLLSTQTRRVRRGAVALLVVLGIGALQQGAAQAGSTPRTSSEVIALEADLAVEALQTWDETGHPIDYVRFVHSRDSVAELTAVELGLDIREVRSNLAGAGVDKQAAALAALTQLGVPYRSIASEQGVGFDCSGLTIWAFGSAGIEIPRVSGDQIAAAVDVEREEATVGDLVYYPGHVGIYLGGEIYVHSPYSGQTVEITMLPSRSVRFGDVIPQAAEGLESE